MGEINPKLLNLMMNKKESEYFYDQNSSSCDEKKLELKLGLPCEEDWVNKQVRERKQQDSLLSLNYLNNNGGGGVRVQSQSTCCYSRKTVDVQQQQNAGKNTAVLPNISQKRAAPAPVVGWPPIRSFRKNLASSSSGKSSAEPQTVIPSKPVNEKQPAENSNKGLFVKINMDGIPIGRKVDLNAYNCYDSLSSAIDMLFRGLLTALHVSPTAGGTENKQSDEQKPITGLLDGTGEYTLVYEDNEGDRMLVGDVPWQMFVSTVKRLRVLKTSDLPTLRRGGSKKDKVMIESAPR